MCCTVLCLATLAWGIDVGWQRLPDGEMEYIIQIEPHVLEALRGGEEIESDIPPALRGVRRYRIRVGTDELPREGQLEPGPELSPGPGGWPPGAGAVTETGPARPGDSGADFPWSQVPQTLPPSTDVRPVGDFREKAAGFVEGQVAAESPPTTDQETEEEPEETEAAKPWLPLTVAWMAAFGSFGGMVFAGWIAWDYRRQYRALLHRMIEGGEGPAATDDTWTSATGL